MPQYDAPAESSGPTHRPTSRPRAFVLTAAPLLLAALSGCGGGGGGPGGTAAPTGLAGRWSGQLALDVERLAAQVPPELRQVIAANAANFRIPLDVECSADGKVRIGAGGVLTPYVIEAEKQGAVIDGTEFANGVTLTEYRAGADSVEFTLHQRSQGVRGIYAGIVGVEIPSEGPKDDTFTLALRKEGDGLQATLTLTQRLKDNIPVTLAGPLVKSGG